MNKKETVKRTSSKRRKPTKSISSDKQRGSAIVELLFATSTLASAVVAVWPWTSTPKLPPAAGE